MSWNESNRVLAAAAGLLVTACAAPQSNVQNSVPVTQTAAASKGKSVTDQQLPINQRFRTLDDYLAWLQQYAAPADQPWYKEIKPGVYELQTAGNLHLDVPSGEKRIFTREELERKFGFIK